MELGKERPAAFDLAGVLLGSTLGAHLLRSSLALVGAQAQGGLFFLSWV
jgi:hypothetical protein